MDGVRRGLIGVAAYRSIEGIGTNPEELMKMAMDATRTFLLQAEDAISVGDQVAKAKALNSAAKVVEFVLGISGTEPGPLSECLAKLYQYVLTAILKGNAWDDAGAVVAGRVAIEQLAAVWRNAFPDPICWPTADDDPPATAEGAR